MHPSDKNIHIIPYTLEGTLGDVAWTHTTDILQYLLWYPSEWRKVLGEVWELSDGKFRKFILYHPLLNQDFCLDTNMDDCLFCRRLQLLWVIEEQGDRAPFSL
jgi:hypothetical protein